MSDGNEPCLVDTNVLIRFADSADPMHHIARGAIQTARQTHDLKVTSQNLMESWNVMTRPKDRNGFGQTVAQADAHLDLVERLFPRLPDPSDAYERWRKLVVRFGVAGVQVHDARLVAVMLGNEVANILTFNANDFQRYAELGIRTFDPRDL